MKSALILSLAGSAVAAPSFGSFFDALFGGSDNNNNAPKPSNLPNFPPIGTGSGVPFPFPTASGAPFPTGSSGAYPGSDRHVKPRAKALHVDYRLAPTVNDDASKRDLKYRQLGGDALPSFSLLDPNNTPTATEPATGLPTEAPTDFPGLPSGTGILSFPTGAPTDLPGLPSGTGIPSFPTGAPTDLPGLPSGFPTPPAGGPTAPFPFPSGDAPFPTDAPLPTAPAGTGFPGLPTTLETLTRGPQPTSAPDAPSQDDDNKPQNGNAWLEWISNLLTGGKESHE
ncbi:hypothetical protein EKO04_007927 [Ascochyta lentis]|uniref:Uncharacterized protein n=1 Tax=Ascochyta lentis TaxID=205686 RepID=A0A8H7J2S7_9PLEO|nr:hypothetical protein EKO04_007927 [Ascochyta lentis]